MKFILQTEKWLSYLKEKSESKPELASALADYEQNKINIDQLNMKVTSSGVRTCYTFSKKLLIDEFITKNVIG